MKKKKDNEISIRSSAAEDLTDVAAIGDNPKSNDNILEKCLPKYLEKDLEKLKEGMKIMYLIWIA